jgi:hypothetical protein
MLATAGTPNHKVRKRDGWNHWDWQSVDCMVFALAVLEGGGIAHLCCSKASAYGNIHALVEWSGVELHLWCGIWSRFIE